MQLIGQKANLEIIDRWEDLPKFLIIQGAPKTGKTHLAQYLCAKFNKCYMQIPNSVEAVRHLPDVMRLDGNTVFHFENFDKASLGAKNALLKISEEMIRGNHIIITGSQQIATLESRAVRLKMNQYSKDEMILHLSNFIPPDVAEKFYIAGINTPAIYEQYKDYENLKDLITYSVSVFEDITSLNIGIICKILKKFKGRITDYDASLMFITFLIHIIESEVVNNFFYSYFEILQKLIEAKNLMVSNPTVNRRMLLYKTFYEIYELKGEV